MNISNLQVTELILHEVFKRGLDPEPIPPDYGTALENLDFEALDALHDRIITAMTSSTRCVQMAITKDGPDSMVERTIAIADAPNASEFIRVSCGVADKLTEEQKSRQIPGGVLVVFRGTVNYPPQKVVGVIKAEVHNGFTREPGTHGHKLKFLNKLMLTAQTKLYKIGIFVESAPFAVGAPASRWEAYIYDETLTMGNREGAAKYFYEGFLGLGFPQSSARQTKKFHEHTKTFIQGLAIDEEEKIVMFNALVTYLKADQSPTVGVTAFADAYIADPVLKDAYHAHMISKEFPTTPISKDISDLKTALKIRNLRFHSKIRLTGPAEEFESLVDISIIDGDRDPTGYTPKWTKVIIKDRLSSQD